MRLQIILIVIDLFLLNLGMLLSFVIRYGIPFPEPSFKPYKETCLFLTLIYMLSLACYGAYKKRFKSSWELFAKISSGMFCGTLLVIAFVYVFRAQWGAFPTSVFIISLFINSALVFKANQVLLKSKKRIKKRVVVFGKGDIEDTVMKRSEVEKKDINQIREMSEYKEIDEIVINEKPQDEKSIEILIYLVQKLKINVIFGPAYYMELLSDRVNGNTSLPFLSTFVGRKRDIDEFLIRTLDILGSLAILFFSAPVIMFFALLIKITSPGPILYKQQRVGKDGKIFTLYKIRTMINDAEKTVGPILAKYDDHRVTTIGRFLRRCRLDEIPQLFNVIFGQMSLVGPRPERPHFAKRHKALREIRLAVKPGLTGLAQIRSFYDLRPKHKIKYDYLYIQNRSLLLNLYIMFKTIPVLLSKKGW